MKTLKELLRLQKEPCIHVDDLQVHRLLTQNRRAYLQALEKGFKYWANHPDRIILPPKAIYKDPKAQGDFRVMPCQIQYPNHTVSTVKVIGTNEESKVVKDKITVGKAFILHPTDHFIMGIFDACVLSSARTAACVALAYKHLGQGTRRIGIVGCGRIGYYSVEFLSLVKHIKKFVCYDPNPKNIVHFKALLGNKESNCEFVETLDEVKNRADAIILSTYTHKPLINADDISQNHIQFISSAGADADNLSELCDDIPSHFSQIIVDSHHSLLIADPKRWKQKGKIRKRDIIELKDIINKTSPTNLKIPRIFITTGIAFLDCITLDYLYKAITTESRAA